MAVLERQPDAETALDRVAHRVARHHPEQLAAGRLVGRRELVVGELAAARLEFFDEAGDHVPGVRQRGADAVEELRVINLADAGPLKQAGRNRERHRCCPFSATVRLSHHPHMKMIIISRSVTKKQSVRWQGVIRLTAPMVPARAAVRGAWGP